MILEVTLYLKQNWKGTTFLSRVQKNKEEMLSLLRSIFQLSLIFWGTDSIFFETPVMGQCWKQDILMSETTEAQAFLIAQLSLLLSHGIWKILKFHPKKKWIPLCLGLVFWKPFLEKFMTEKSTKGYYYKTNSAFRRPFLTDL